MPQPLSRLTAKQVIKLIQEEGIEAYFPQLMTEIDFSKRKWDKLANFIAKQYIATFPYLSNVSEEKETENKTEI